MIYLITVITSAFSAKFIPVNRFKVAVMVQRLQHILLQVLNFQIPRTGTVADSESRQ